MNGDTVLYGDAGLISRTLEYDFNTEKNFDYSELSKEEIVKHLTRFIANIWQVHPFGEGNTRPTAEKQNLLLTNIATYQMAQQTGFSCPLTWNDTGEECELWTFEQLLQLSMEIRNYVSPIISFQQYMEVNINKCTTIEQLNEVNIDFTEEAVEEYKPIYYKKIGVSNE